MQAISACHPDMANWAFSSEEEASQDSEKSLEAPAEERNFSPSTSFR
jgi:hypothetical protein